MLSLSFTSALIFVALWQTSSEADAQHNGGASLKWAEAKQSRRKLSVVEEECICPIVTQPVYSDTDRAARWMVHSLDWGVLSTQSSRLPNSPPFGNVYSFVDGPCDMSTGIPYFYGSHMDQSFKDVQLNSAASFSLSKAALPSVCSTQASCDRTFEGDPENPVCARLTLTGTFVEVTDEAEIAKVKSWLMERHPAMSNWPSDHQFVLAKLIVEDIWFIDFFGGANILDPTKYFAATLDMTPAVMPSPPTEGRHKLLTWGVILAIPIIVLIYVETFRFIFKKRQENYCTISEDRTRNLEMDDLDHSDQSN